MRPNWILPLLLSAVASMGMAQTPAPPGLDEAEAMLVQPFLGRVPLADTITAYPSPDGPLVPFGELCRLLQFGIQVEADRGRAEGFFISPKRRFALDLAAARVEVEGRASTLQPGQVIRRGQELFVQARLLQAWFPLEVSVSLKSAVLTMKALEKLPIQEAWERDRRYGAGNLNPTQTDIDGPPIGQAHSTPYSFLDVPMADLSLYWSRGRATGSPPPQTSAFLGGDLLWMSANAYGTRDSDGKLRNARATLFREDPRGELLGPMHARRVTLGDLQQAPSLEISGALPQGRGVLVDNFPIGYRSKFATRTFQGLLPEGWTVEFFHNGSLLGFQRARPDGQYQFRDVPLRFGLNQFRLVFHGPLGERREENHRMDIASEQPPPGTFYYRVAALRPRLEVSTLDPSELNHLDDLQRPATFLEADYGLTSYLAVNAGSSRVALPDGYHTYTEAGLRSLFSYLSLQMNGAMDQGEAGKPPGLAASGLLRTGYDYSTFTFQRTEYRRGFQRTGILSALGVMKPLRSEMAADLYGSFSLGKVPLGLTVSRTVDEYATGGWSSRDRLQCSATFPMLSVSQSLYRTAESSRRGPAPLEGNLLVTSYARTVGLQGELAFKREAGRSEITGWGASADFQSPGGTLYRAMAKGTRGSLRDASFIGLVSRMVGRFAWGLDVHYAKASSYTVGLRLQTSLGREPRTGTWVASAQPMASMGAVSAQAFLDSNGNGTRDPGERVIEGAQFKTINAPIENRIQDSRTVFTTHLSRGQEVPVLVDEGSLEDPAQQSTVRAYRIVPRSGKTTRLDFPIQAFGEITGTTRLRRAEGVIDYGGVEVELLNAAGQRVRVLRSAFDGFFELRDLPLGEYTLRISPQEVARLRFYEPPARQVRIETAKNLFEGQDFTLEPLAPPAPAPVSANAPWPPPAAPTQVPAPAPVSTPDPAIAPAAPAWTILLVAATREDTISRARDALGPLASDVFLRPFRATAGGGTDLRLVCFGSFPTREAAARALAALPPYFFKGGNQPKVIPLESVPQGRQP